jgi:hypothetical protein
MALARFSWMVFAFGLLAAAAWHGASVRAAGKPLLVIMAASSRNKDISTSTLRRVFQGLSTEFEGSKRFIPVNHPIGTPARIQFDRTVLGLEPNQVGAFWIDRAHSRRDAAAAHRTICRPGDAHRGLAARCNHVHLARDAQFQRASAEHRWKICGPARLSAELVQRRRDTSRIAVESGSAVRRGDEHYSPYSEERQRRG